MSKLNSIIWFLKRPNLLPQAWQIIKRRVLHRNDELKKNEAIVWAKDNCIGQELFLNKLGIDKIFNFENDQSKFVKETTLKAQNCKISMGGPGALNVLYNLTLKFSSGNILETGVAYGWSSMAILCEIKEDKGSLISIDMPYVNLNNDKVVGIVVPEVLNPNWLLIRKADRQGIPQALKKFQNQVDLVHYDSDKSYSGRMWAYPLLWKAIKKGGMLISDDIQDNVGFKDFCTSIEQQPLVTESDNKYVGALIKH